MKFTIVTCTRNSALTLKQCIDSVRIQSYPFIEQIFVDGSSTDSTLEMIAEMAPHASVIHDIGGGISNAMNVGVAAATGDVIAHLHSDDYYLDASVISDVARSMLSGALWAFGRIVRDINGNLIPESYTAPAYTASRLLRGNFIPHPATFVKRSVFESVGGFDVTLRYAMDYDLWLRISRLHSPEIISRPLAAFREHSGSASTANRVAAVHEDHVVRVRHLGKPLMLRLPHELRYLKRKLMAKKLIATGA